MISLQQYHSLKADDFELVVNYIGLDETQPGKAQLELIRQPKGIRSVKIEPAEVDYLIEKRAAVKGQEMSSEKAQPVQMAE